MGGHKKAYGIFELSKIWSAQGAVGFRQVELGQKRIRSLGKHPTKLMDYILDNPIVVVLGPKKEKEVSAGGSTEKGRKKKGRAYGEYVVDHNHLARALIREGYKTAPMKIVADFRKHSYEVFLEKMHEAGFLHPHNEKGQLIALTETPRRIANLKDDPYRSLAGFVRRAGGFNKVKTPFAEFQWADYFRQLIKKSLIANDFDKAVKQGIKLAQVPEACDLPGYKGGYKKPEITGAPKI